MSNEQRGYLLTAIIFLMAIGVGVGLLVFWLIDRFGPLIEAWVHGVTA